MTIDQYDLEVLRQQQQDKVRRHERALARWRYGSMVVGYVAAAGATLGLAFMLWQGVAGPSAEDQLEDGQRRECIAEHGTWVKIADGTETTGTCLFGERP
jgi:hypothetical protein